MKISIDRLRRYCRASALAYEAGRQANRKRLAAKREFERAERWVEEIDATPNHSEKTMKRALENRALAQAAYEAAIEEHENANEHSSLAGRIATNCREYAASIGQLPPDLEA